MEHAATSGFIPDETGSILHLDDARKDYLTGEADRERARALKRQQRNVLLMNPYHAVCERMKGLQFSKSDMRFGDEADIEGIGTLLLDTMSELMIQSPAMLVPHEDLVGHIVPHVAAMGSFGNDQARYLVEKFVDLLSNREDGSKPFSVRSWSFDRKTWSHERLRYMIYEEVEDERGWRLSEDGMRMTLRLLNTDADGGNINHDLLERAFQRKNIDEILYTLNQHKASARRQGSLIRAAVRDIRMMTYLNWEHVGDPIFEGRSMVAKLSENTQTFVDNIQNLIGDESIDQVQRARLAQALDTLKEIDQTTRNLSIIILDCETEVVKVLAQSIRIMGGVTMMPDLFGEVLAPMVSLKGDAANTYCDLLNHIFTAPQPVTRIFDLGQIITESNGLVDDIADGDFADDVAEEDEFVDLEGMDIRTRKEVKDIFEQLVAVRPRLQALAERFQISEWRYFGDIDPEGMKIAIDLAKASARLDGPIVRPFRQAYAWLARHGMRVSRSRKVRDEQDLWSRIKDDAAAWVGDPLVLSRVEEVVS